MEKYENSEYEMLKKSTENTVKNSPEEVKETTVKNDSENNLKGIVSLVLGLITLFLHHLWYVAIITGIIGIVFGVKSNIKGNKNKKGKAGMILSIVGLAIMLAVYGLFSIIILLSTY